MGANNTQIRMSVVKEMLNNRTGAGGGFGVQAMAHSPEGYSVPDMPYCITS